MTLIPSATNSTTTVLVTGGSGLVGSNCIAQLLKLGYQVRTTIRSENKEKIVLEMMKNANLTKEVSHLHFFQADLTDDKGWEEATKGCDYMLHVASPFPLSNPPNENDLIIPAKEGTLRALYFAKKANVKRVVLTSSIVAVTLGINTKNYIFTENDWSDFSHDKTQMYAKSKTVAEKAAWQFVESEGEGLELVVINPAGVLGPILGHGSSSSISIIDNLMSGKFARGVPDIMFGIVDVRDVAELHIRAMITPDAKGQRFIATNKIMSMLQIANVIKEHFPSYKNKLPSQVIPVWTIWLASWVSTQAKWIYQQIGVRRTCDNSKARHTFGWKPIPIETTICDTVESLKKYGNDTS